jgi:hypothetical protein
VLLVGSAILLQALLQRLGLTSKPATLVALIGAATIVVFGAPAWFHLRSPKRSLRAPESPPPPIDARTAEVRRSEFERLVTQRGRPPDQELPDWLAHLGVDGEPTTTRRWSVSGSVGPESHIESHFSAQKPGDAEVHEVTFSGTPGELLRQLFVRLSLRRPVG